MTAHIDVPYVAHLAQIQLTDSEITLFQEQLDQVLQYVEQLRELNISDVEPTAHAMPLVNVLRDDLPRESLPHDAVLANAPAIRDEQFSVPKILE